MLIKEVSRRCELCSEAAAVYCPSDSAYLCCTCDSAVHSANFLVARHARSTLCSWCGDFDGELFSGAGNRRLPRSACKSCGRLANEDDNGNGKGNGNDSDDDEEDVSDLSSVCVSTNESSTACPAAAASSRDRDCCGEVSSEMRRRRSERARPSTVDGKVEGVLVNWCRRIGLEGGQDDVVLATAAQVLGRLQACLPVRVALAASFWLGLRFCGVQSRDLKRVEKITGVPDKMILAVETKLERVLKTRRGVPRHSDYQEGWAEC